MSHPLLALVHALLPLRDAAGHEMLALADLTPDDDDGGLTVGLRATVHDDSSAVYAMCEQLTTLVPAQHLDHPALAAYLRASFAAAPAMFSADLCPMPSELFFPELLALPDVTDEAEFTALLADPARRAALLAERDASDRLATYTAAVGPDHAARLLALRRPRYLLLSERVDDEDDADLLPLGGSRLGGRPDLPAGFAWPHAGEQALTFLAQIDLAGLPPLPPGPDADLLPRTGVLSLFLGLAGGDDPARGPGRLLHFADARALVRTPPPAGRDDLVLVASELTAEPDSATLPGWEQPHLALALATFADERPYERAAALVRDILLYDGTTWPEEQPRHQLLGWPAVLQSDPLAAAAYDEREHLGVPHPPEQSQESAEQAAQWRLLLQLDSEDLDFMLGDDGMVHVLIREPDLRAGRFERARIVWQMH